MGYGEVIGGFGFQGSSRPGGLGFRASSRGVWWILAREHIGSMDWV